MSATHFWLKYDKIHSQNIPNIATIKWKNRKKNEKTINSPYMTPCSLQHSIMSTTASVGMAPVHFRWHFASPSPSPSLFSQSLMLAGNGRGSFLHEEVLMVVCGHLVEEQRDTVSNSYTSATKFNVISFSLPLKFKVVPRWPDGARFKWLKIHIFAVVKRGGDFLNFW